MTNLQNFLRIAKAQVGVTESPPDSNSVSYNMWYWGKDMRAPWCMAFIMYCLSMANISVGIKTASCGELMRHAKSVGRWITDGYMPGDICLFDFSGRKGAPSHCGIIVEVQPTQIITIEGNTGVGDDANGGKVMERKRAYKHVVGCMRPDFKEEPEMTDKEVYEALTRYLKSQELPNWAKAEMEEAIAAGITDGSMPMGLLSRYQGAIMAKRAAKMRE